MAGKDSLRPCEDGTRKSQENAVSDEARPQGFFGQTRKPVKMFRAGLYARVSTSEQQAQAGARLLARVHGSPCGIYRAAFFSPKRFISTQSWLLAMCKSREKVPVR